jgi:hypothetical protein
VEIQPFCQIRQANSAETLPDITRQNQDGVMKPHGCDTTTIVFIVMQACHLIVDKYRAWDCLRESVSLAVWLALQPLWLNKSLNQTRI